MVTWGWLKMENWLVWKKTFFLAFLTKIGNLKLLRRETAKNGQTSEVRKKGRKKSCLGRCQQPLCWFFYPKKLQKYLKINKNRKKRTSIGVKLVIQLIADNVYRATFRKNIENEKWPTWQISLFKKVPKKTF